MEPNAERDSTQRKPHAAIDASSLERAAAALTELAILLESAPPSLRDGKEADPPRDREYIEALRTRIGRSVALLDAVFPNDAAFIRRTGRDLEKESQAWLGDWQSRVELRTRFSERYQGLNRHVAEHPEHPWAADMLPKLVEVQMSDSLKLPHSTVVPQLLEQLESKVASTRVTLRATTVSANTRSNPTMDSAPESNRRMTKEPHIEATLFRHPSMPTLTIRGPGLGKSLVEVKLRGRTRALLAYAVMSQPGQDHTWEDLLKAGLDRGDWSIASSRTLVRQGRRIRQALPRELRGFWEQSTSSVRWTKEDTSVAVAATNPPA